MKILFSFLLLCSFTNIKSTDGCLKLDIILIGDVSSSTNGHLNFIANAMDAFVDRFELNEDGIKIGVVSFESFAYLQNGLTHEKSKIKNSINKIRNYHHGSTTKMGDAFHLAGNEILKNGRIDAMKIVVIITDGDPYDEDSAILASEELKKLLLVGICGVLIKDGSEKPDFLKTISSDYCYVESNYDNLISELKKLDVCL